MKQEETIQVFKNYFNYIKRPGRLTFCNGWTQTASLKPRQASDTTERNPEGLRNIQ